MNKNEEIKMNDEDYVETEMKFEMEKLLCLQECDKNNVFLDVMSNTHVMVTCFVPLRTDSSLLPMIPQILLDMREIQRQVQVQILHHTHIYLPVGLVYKLRDGTERFMLDTTKLLQKNIENIGPFTSVVPEIINALIAQIQMVGKICILLQYS